MYLLFYWRSTVASNNCRIVSAWCTRFLRLQAEARVCLCFFLGFRDGNFQVPLRWFQLQGVQHAFLFIRQLVSLGHAAGRSVMETDKQLMEVLLDLMP